VEFGKVSNPSGLDLSLKKPSFYSPELNLNKPKWHLGCPIWNHTKLIQKIRTQEDRGKSALEIYSKNFNSIELNSSYYSVPSSEQIKKWRAQTPPDFKFFPKAPKDLCFYAQEKVDAKTLNFYLKSLQDFGGQCGESFIQFSPYIGPPQKKYLFNFLEALPRDFNFSIELRHEDWFNTPTLLNNLCTYLNKKNIGLVITDTPGRRDVLHMHFPVNRAFVRFKGHNSHPSDQKRLQAWVEIFKDSAKFKDVFFFHHHSDEEHCFESIKVMTELIGDFSANTLKALKDQTVSDQISLL